MLSLPPPTHVTLPSDLIPHGNDDGPSVLESRAMFHSIFQPINFKLITSSSTSVADSRLLSTMCFTRDENTAECTRDQRTFLEICCMTRQRALKSLVILTLYRPNPSDGEVTEYKMRFDLEKTCLCLHGWVGLGLGPENGGGKARGLDFARDIKRVALVVSDEEVKNEMFLLRGLFMMPNSCQFALLFHNAQHVSGITSSALEIRKFLGHQAFFDLFSFQLFEQKRMVQGFHLTESYTERRRLLCLAMLSTFEGWNGRIQEALRQAALLNILERINRNGPDQLWQTSSSIEFPCGAVPVSYNRR